MCYLNLGNLEGMFSSDFWLVLKFIVNIFWKLFAMPQSCVNYIMVITVKNDSGNMLFLWECDVVLWCIGDK